MDNKESSFENVCFLTELLKCGVFGETIGNKTADKLSPETLADIYALSSEYDLSHIIGEALDKNGLLPEGMLSTLYINDVMAANFRYEKLSYAFSEVCGVLEEERISFLPLKGSVLYNIYPEKWMRVGCDIDILVHKEDIPKIEKSFEEKLGYHRCGESYHDVRMKSPDGVVIELHHTLIEEGWANNANKILENVWEYVYPQSDGAFHYFMTEEMFYFYHIAHMAKHIENGGCGIKPFLDLYVMLRTYGNISKTLICESDLLTFDSVVTKLCRVWFDTDEHNETSVLLQRFVLDGGAYGNRENMAYIQKGRAGGKVKYILFKLFPPYSKLKYEFPILCKFKFLFPIYTVYRWFCFLFKKDKKERIKNFVLTKDASKEKSSEMAELFEKIGL